MAEWAEGASEQVPVDAGAESAAPAVESGGVDAAQMQAQLQAVQNQMAAMQQTHQTQLHSIYSAMAGNQPAQQQAPAAPPMPEIPGIDKEDPYYDQFSQIFNSQVTKNSEMQTELQGLRQQLDNMTLSMSRQNVHRQVEEAIEHHRVPESLAQDVRTVAYAHMASSPNGNMDANGFVRGFMQNLGVYANDARKQWADEAKRPKPLGVAITSAGVSDEPPKTMEEAKARSLAIMKAMSGG